MPEELTQTEVDLLIQQEFDRLIEAVDNLTDEEMEEIILD